MHSLHEQGLRSSLRHASDENRWLEEENKTLKDKIEKITELRKTFPSKDYPVTGFVGYEPSSISESYSETAVEDWLDDLDKILVVDKQ